MDLECTRGHSFEGWFGSFQIFEDQCNRSLVECPICGDANIVKKLSAPRLNLGHSNSDERQEVAAAISERARTQAWLELSRQIAQNTDDVGDQFAQEARRIHYGHAAARGIRGSSSLGEAVELLEEGIPVVPLQLADVHKGTLQ